MWHLLPGRHWPMLPEQELAFVVELERRAGTKKVRPKRDDLTMLLSALRCGTDAEVLFDHAPGTDPASLLSCYRWVDGLRQRSVNAWEAIEQSPGKATIHHHSPEAVKLLPIPVRRIVATLEGVSAGHHRAAQLAEAVAEASAQVRRVSVRAHGLEAELDRIWHHNPDELTLSQTEKTTREIGERLYDPLAPGIYGDAYFLANRVSTLSPMRVRDLLGERHVHPQLTV
jgi:hypothetical protein